MKSRIRSDETLYRKIQKNQFTMCLSNMKYFYLLIALLSATSKMISGRNDMYSTFPSQERFMLSIDDSHTNLIYQLVYFYRRLFQIWQ